MMEIFITTQFIGFHKYPKAPEIVSFLRSKHRHLFKVRVQFAVSHTNRQLEFFIMQKEINGIIDSYINKKDAGSCEAIANIILDKCLKANYPITKIEVSEDGENGAIITVPKLSDI